MPRGRSWWPTLMAGDDAQSAMALDDRDVAVDVRAPPTGACCAQQAEGGRRRVTIVVVLADADGRHRRVHRCQESGRLPTTPVVWELQDVGGKRGARREQCVLCLGLDISGQQQPAAV